MQLASPGFGTLQRVITASRLLIVALAVLATAVGGLPTDARLALLGAEYLAWSGLLWQLAPRLQRAWLIYPVMLVDVGALSALIGLWPTASLPLWVLYLLLLAGIAPAGRVPTAVAAGLSIIGYLAAVWYSTDSPSALVLWPVALIGGSAVVFSAVATRWLTEQQEREGWREVAATREELRRERVLREAATAMSGTLERQTVQEAILTAGRAGLGAIVALLDRTAGYLLASDDRAERLAELSSGDTAPAGEAEVSSPAAPLTEAPVITPLVEGLELLAWRADPRLDEADAAWLEQLATIARAALLRSAEHEQLQEELDRLSESFEAVPAPLAVWEPNGSLVRTNAAYRALGLEAEQPGEPPATGVREREVTLGDPARTFIVMSAPVAGGRYGFSLYREITREREALHAKDELISLVGHELRNPLTSIQDYSQMMGRQLRVVQQQVEQLNRLIGDFMDTARLEDGQLPLAREAVDLAGLARGAADRFRGAYQDRDLRLEVGEVPPVEADPTRLGQVLDNLLSNAAKYSAPESEIVLALTSDGQEVLLSVQDRGVGIAPEHLPRLFDRFYRVPGAETERVRGLGLGLSIVHDLVRAQGGRIWAESAGEGQGSTFWVALPALSSERVARLQAVGTDGM